MVPGVLRPLSSKSETSQEESAPTYWGGHPLEEACICLYLFLFKIDTWYTFFEKKKCVHWLGSKLQVSHSCITSKSTAEIAPGT